MKPIDRVLKQLRSRRAALARYGVRHLSIFGSTARNKPNARDIDILVEFEKPTFDRYMDLKFYLEDLLKKRVDLLTKEAIRPEIRESIEKDAVLVA